jgi:hypothetical protein
LSKWERHPKQSFQPSPFIPQPWTCRGFGQCDALRTLAVLHRSVTAPLTGPDGARLKYGALTAEPARDGPARPAS